MTKGGEQGTITAEMGLLVPPGKMEPPPEILPSVITLNNLKQDLNSLRTIVKSFEVELVTPVSAQRKIYIYDSPNKVVRKVESP